MGMLDDILGSALGGSARPGQQRSLANAVLGMLGNQGSGGLNGLLSLFTQQGLGNQVQSWIGTGQNQPVTPEQITAALGTERVSQIATEAGLEPRETSASLAALIPGFVDKLTPNGRLPENQELEHGFTELYGAIENPRGRV